eukprot:5973899-Amphidinium_carterae.1
MSAVTIFGIHANSFEGTIPEIGIRSMSAVTSFGIHTNSFKGTIPESGIQRMSEVTDFEICINSFQGALPESGFQAMRAVGFFAHKNDFEGKMCMTNPMSTLVFPLHVMLFAASKTLGIIYSNFKAFETHGISGPCLVSPSWKR